MPIATYTTAGSYAWNSPTVGCPPALDYVYSIGGGGGGAGLSGMSGGGGGGGGIGTKINYLILANFAYGVVVGAGGTGGSNGAGADGGYSNFNNDVTVNGNGGGGAFDDGSNGIGGSGVTYAGGNGGAGGQSGSAFGGAGGGGAAGLSGGGGNGGDSPDVSFGTGGTGGGGSPSGGNGGNGATFGSGSSGLPGQAPGGGGGGAPENNTSGGNGADGLVIFGWTFATPNPSACTPADGPLAGISVTITCPDASFSDGCTVLFGSVPGTSVVVVDASTITCVVPAASASSVSVTVTNVDNQSGSITNGFTFHNAPNPSACVPSNGNVAGGDSITVTGGDNGFVTAVSFGSGSATGITGGFGNIVCTNPSGSVGLCDVVVTDVWSQTGTISSGFQYLPNPPNPTSILPTSGNVAGGDSVTITGTDFDVSNSDTVAFGAFSATSVIVVDSMTITCDTPIGSVGAVDIVVTDIYSQSGTLSSGFFYLPNPPNPTSILPTSGSIAGGTPVTITGTDFDFAMGDNVLFAGVPATGATVGDSMTMYCTTPAGSVGAVDVEVQDVYAQSGTLTNGFTYTASPSTGGSGLSGESGLSGLSGLF